MPGRPKGPGKPRPPKGKNDEFFLNLVRQGILGVGTDGSVWRLQGRGITAPRRIDQDHGDGYRCISANGRHMYVHRLVWVVERGPIPPGMEINHRDGDRSHNQLENLEILTGSANQTLAYQRPNRWRPIGELAGTARLTEAKVREVRRLYAEGTIIADIARRFGVERSTIRAVVLGATWRHV